MNAPDVLLGKMLHEPYAGLLAGIVFGTKATLSRDLYDMLIQTGTIHIIALSGFNITILASITNMTILPFLGRVRSSIVTIMLIALFIWYVGPGPSIVRAGIMGTLSLLAVIYGRQAWALYSLIISSGIMLLYKPEWLANISFQLSVVSTLGIILFGRKKYSGHKMLKRFELYEKDMLARWDIAHVFEKLLYMCVKGVQFVFQLFSDDLRVTLAAQVFTVPLIFYYFHRVSLVSPIANMLIGWAIAPVTVFGICATVLGVLWLPLGRLCALCAWIFLKYIITVVSLTSRVPFASVGF